MERQKIEQKNMISDMLKDGKLKKVGRKIAEHYHSTNSLASVVSYSESVSSPEKEKENLPLINVSHVLKSHLSKNRGKGLEMRDWQLSRLIHTINQLPMWLLLFDFYVKNYQQKL